MDMRGASRDRAIDRALEDPDMINIEYAEHVPPATPPTHLHIRKISESQNLLPNSPKNLFEYSSTKKFTFDRPENAQYNPHNVRKINGRESPMWSGVPQTLRKTSGRRWRELIIDLIAVLASIPFFALASALIWVDGEQATDEKDNSLNQLIKAAATLFPLIFSVVVGRSMVKIASWKLEQGTSLGFLEHLLGSRTVGGALITSIGLRTITIGSLVLVLIWLLSPLGSQSILRILSTENTPIESSSNVTYINLRQQNYAGQSQSNAWSNGLAALISASLLAPEEVKTSSVDTWGNLKIPFFSSLSNISEDENGWRQIRQSNLTPSYSSLFGIPVSLRSGNSTFKVESTYMELACSNRTSAVTRKPGLFIDPGLISTSGPFIAAQNLSSTTAWAIGYLGDDTTSMLPNTSIQALDTLPFNSTEISNVLPGLLFYQDFTGTQNVTSIYCVPFQTYVESDITCTTTSDNTSPSCAVTAQRLSLLPNPPPAITLLSISNLFRGLSSMLPAATPQLNHIDIMQNYIYSPLNNSFIQSALYPTDTLPPGSESRFLNLSLPDFGIRLAQVLNTFLEGSTKNYTTYLTSSSKFPTDTSLPLASTPKNLTMQIQNLQPFLSVPATTSISTTTFKTSRIYIALFFLSTTILFLSAILSLFLSQITLLPSSYLTHLSSLLRDSPYLPEFPTGGVLEDGLKRARELAGLKVRVGDVGVVGAGFEIGVGAAVVVGKVGIGVVGEDGVRELERGRMYL